MSETVTANVGASSTAHSVVGLKEPERPRLLNSFAIRCEVEADGTLRLIPTDALSAYYLHHFGHGQISASWTYMEGGSRLLPDAPYHWTRAHASLVDVRLRSEPRPMLSRGGDPFWTGRPLNAEDHEALHNLLERRVAARSREWAKKRDAERKTSEPKPTPRSRPSKMKRRSK